MVYFKQAQGAMEFLMAYGWAIIAVLLTIGALAYFGVINTSTLFPESCTMFPGVACTDFYANKAEMVMTLRNGGGVPYSTFSLGIAGCSTGIAQGGLLDGERESIVLPGCSFIDDKAIRKDLQITYTSGGVLHTKTGRINTFIDNNYIRNGGVEYDIGLNYGSGDSTAGDGEPDGWTRQGKATTLSSPAHSGLYAQLYDQQSGTDSFLSGVFRQVALPVNPGSYKLSFWATKTLPNSLGGAIRANVYDADSGGIYYEHPPLNYLGALPPNSLTQNVWNQFSIPFTVPKNDGTNGNGYINIYIYVGNGILCPCAIFVDDIRIEKV